MRKICAHYIFPVVSGPLKNGILHVDDEGRITSVIDTRGKIKEESQLEFYDGIIVPGFINAHCHLELSHLKNKIPEGKGLPAFIQAIKNMRETPEDVIREAIVAADREMYKKGIVAAGDISNTPHSFPVKANSPVVYHTFLEIFGLAENHTAVVIQHLNHLLTEAKKYQLRFSITPHSAYALSYDLLKQLASMIKEQQSPVSIHFLESEEEKILFTGKEGLLYEVLSATGNPHKKEKHPLDVFAGMPLQHSHCLFVHNTFAQASDIKKIRQQIRHPFLVLCPRSNLYIENTLPPVQELMGHGIPLAIGTDSLASNHDLSVLEELKTLQALLPSLSLTELIPWATLNGAKALNLDETMGSFEKGKKPGINLIRNIHYEKLQLTPSSTVERLI